MFYSDKQSDNEKLSALVDGEVIDKSLLSALSIDKESSDAWANYHLIGDVIRGEAPASKEWNIAGSVALALESEPSHRLHSSVNVVEFMESQPIPTQARRSLPTWVTQLGQIALTACVSLAVIVGVQQYNGVDSSGSAMEQLPVLNTIPFSGSVEPVSLTRDSMRHSSKNEAQLMEQRRRVNAMLQDYELQLRLNAQNSTINSDLLTQDSMMAE
ncbi:MAG: anti-sigma E factor [Aliivibrio sp.]|uniref:RseA family anti-sigma factor n=1 Tax=Aliivibrio sp. TaxID=1872443 RepID=UPI001A44B9DD|nr:anti-sigma E factor [Aliivibrio sp.]